jgi:hypothetical protein
VGGWKTFLRNHAPDVAAMDLFVVPIMGFKLLYGFVIVRIAPRSRLDQVTTNPTAEWIARQLTEAFPWDGAPGYMIRDRDRIYGTVVTRRLRAMGVRDKPIAPASPWQNGIAERLIGSIRRECLDHIIVSGEAHLRRILISYAAYYNRASEHPSGYVIDEKRFCWLGCDPAGSFPVQSCAFGDGLSSKHCESGAGEDPRTIGQRMDRFDLSGFSRQPERLGCDLQDLCGVAEVEPRLDPVLCRLEHRDAVVRTR